jgi:hypothetical protein
MPKLGCTLCNHEWATSIHDVWSCPNCEIGAADYHVLEFDQSELKEFNRIFDTARTSVLNCGINTSGGIFPAFIHEAHLSESLLDLLVMFFDHVVLYIDTFNIEGDKHRFGDKLQAYTEQEFISVFAWENYLPHPRRAVEPKIVMDQICPTTAETGPIHTYVEKRAEVQTAIDLRFVSNDEITLVLNKAWPRQKYFGLTGEDRLKMMLWMDVHMHLLNRLNAFTILCNLLDLSAMTDRSLAELKKLKYRQTSEAFAKHSQAIFGLIEWYAKKIEEYPKFEKPESMIKFRKEVAREEFLNFTINGFASLGTGKSADGVQVSQKVIDKIEKHIAKAICITGNKYRQRGLVLSGLVATVGGLIGGELGAIVGGIGSTIVPMTLERLDRNRVAPWATYFIEKDCGITR